MKKFNSADAHLIQNTVYIQGLSITNKGVPILYGEVFAVDISDVEKMGAYLLTALKNSTIGVPHPDWKTEKEKDEPLLIAAGLKSWKKIMQISKRISIDLQDGILTFIPCKLMGVSGRNKGYTFLYDKKFSCSPDPLSLGQALIKAFELCE